MDDRCCWAGIMAGEIREIEPDELRAKLRQLRPTPQIAAKADDVVAVSPQSAADHLTEKAGRAGDQDPPCFAHQTRSPSGDPRHAAKREPGGRAQKQGAAARWQAPAAPGHIESGGQGRRNLIPQRADDIDDAVFAEAAARCQMP